MAWTTGEKVAVGAGVVFAGLAATFGILEWRKKPASNSVVQPPGGPYGVTLAAGQNNTTVPNGQTLTISLPAGASWQMDPNSGGSIGPITGLPSSASVPQVGSSSSVSVTVSGAAQIEGWWVDGSGNQNESTLDVSAS